MQILWKTNPNFAPHENCKNPKKTLKFFSGSGSFSNFRSLIPIQGSGIADPNFCSWDRDRFKKIPIPILGSGSGISDPKWKLRDQDRDRFATIQGSGSFQRDQGSRSCPTLLILRAIRKKDLQTKLVQKSFLKRKIQFNSSLNCTESPRESRSFFWS